LDRSFDVARHPIVFQSPRRLTADSAWVEHIPFAMLLVELTEPRLFVELGTHGGDSYCAFCQAVDTFNLPTRCFAVDTWKGDEHAGFFTDEVLENLRAHHDETYGSFSSLVRATFDEAVDQFEDGSIDLLHIDGFHTYEAVRHDFDTWRPKLSDRGVVLFHDTNERGGEFGVWRLWAEVSEQHPHFELAHGHGLGVLSVGPNEPPGLREFRASFESEPWVQTLFYELGRRLGLQTHLMREKRSSEHAARERDRLNDIIRIQQDALEEKDRGLALQHAALEEKDRGLAVQHAALEERDRELDALRAALAGHESELAKLRTFAEEYGPVLAARDSLIAEQEASLAASRAEGAAASAELDQLRQRAGYRVLESTIRKVDRVAPWSTRRRQVLLAGAKAARIVVTEGPASALKRLPRVATWAPHVLGVARLSQTPPALPPPPPPGQELTYNEEYQIWLYRHAPGAQELAAQAAASKELPYRPKISILMPVYNTRPEWLVEAVESVRAQSYPNWELCIVDDASPDPAVRKVLRRYRLQRRIHTARLAENSGIAAASNRALSMATGEFIGFLDHDDELKPNALYEVVKLLNTQRLDFIYTDEDKKEPDGRLVDPFFKPDWSPELFRTANYVTHFAVYRASVVERVGRLRKGYDGSQDHDLALRVTEVTDRIAHIPLPLYTWRKVPGSAAGSPDAKPWAYQAGALALRDSLRRRGLTGDVGPGLWKGSHRIRYHIRGEPTVGIVIPTRDRVDLLRQCIGSIEALSTYSHHEIIVVDNASADPETLDFLSTVKGRVIGYPGSFNFAHMMNTAAREARTDMLLFLNNDTEVITPQWIEAMLEYAQQPHVGAVGARLLYPQGHPQHEGIIMGLGHGTAGNVDHGGYFSMSHSVLNATAVTAACMMTRTALFTELGGFEERLTVAFNDVDFCLRVRHAGYEVVYTPYAELYHYESASRGSLHPPADEAFFCGRWGAPGTIVDPYYNPNLDLSRPYRIKIDDRG
jgi:GT2 family glycosyltransferase